MTEAATQLQIRPPRRGELELLREIAAESKGSWGYEAGRVRGWAAGLDLAALAAEGEVFVATIGGRPVAWAALLSPAGGVCVLDHLWVQPEWMGKGIGARLFTHAAERANGLGARTMEWEAEPNSVGFYQNMGGRYVRDAVSEWGRVLPVMAVDLERQP